MARRVIRAVRRLAFVLAVLPLAAAPSIASIASARAPAVSAAITWNVDHAAKTITVRVNIAVYVTSRPDNPLAQKALLDAAARIEAAIRQKWANLKFKCYQFIVDPHVRLASGADDVGQTEFGVQLDTGVYPVSSRVTGPGGATSAPVRSSVMSVVNADAATDSPILDVEPQTGPMSVFHSVWAFVDAPAVYAHEFGHLLGLTDYYVNDGTGALKPGAVPDVMAHHALPVSPETVTKVIRIGGQVDESTIKCPFSIDVPDTQIGLPTVVAGTVGGTVGYHAWACDYDPPSTDPNRRTPIPVTVLFRGYGGANAGPLGAAEGGGVSQYSVSIPPPAVGGSSVFVIDLGTGGTVSTPLAWTQGGLTATGQVQLASGGGVLALGTSATVSEGAPECP